MGTILTAAAYGVYAAFWLRFLMHALVWWRSAPGPVPDALPRGWPRFKACLLWILDMLFLGRLLKVNPALWLGEWLFHFSLFLVLVRHLRYVLDPVPSLIWAVQAPGLIAGYVLPLSLIYIMLIRLFGQHERYAARANVGLMSLLFAISIVGILMHDLYRQDLVAVKSFILGITRFAPADAPRSLLFVLHFTLALVMVPLLPTHIVTASFVMREARTREQALDLLMHEDDHETARERSV